MKATAAIVDSVAMRRLGRNSRDPARKIAARPNGVNIDGMANASMNAKTRAAANHATPATRSASRPEAVNTSCVMFLGACALGRSSRAQQSGQEGDARAKEIFGTREE